jgi:glycyl-tRNA synthetase
MKKLNVKRKRIEKAKVRFGDTFNEAEFVSTNTKSS